MDNALSPNIVFTLWDVIPVTSAHIGLWFVTISIAIMAFFVNKNANIIPSALQMFFEGIYNWFWEKVEPSFENEKIAKRVFPLVTTFFIVILFSNIFGLYPLLSNMILNGAPLFKTPTAHLSMTLSFTLITIIITHATALYMRPLKYIGNYIQIAPLLKVRSFGDLGSALLDVFLGLLDIIGEIAKVVSLSCRLFGNVLAGELMAIVIIGLSVYTQFLVPVPFLVLGLFAGIIQAAVFALLSLQYISLAVDSVKD